MGEISPVPEKRSDPLLYLLSSCAALASLFSCRISSREERLNPVDEAGGVKVHPHVNPINLPPLPAPCPAITHWSCQPGQPHGGALPRCR